MAKQTLDLGTIADDGTGDPIRSGGSKINSNFDELYAADLINIKSVPLATHFLVTNLYVNATTGSLVVEYDDTPT